MVNKGNTLLSVTLFLAGFVEIVNKMRILLPRLRAWAMLAWNPALY